MNRVKSSLLLVFLFLALFLALKQEMIFAYEDEMSFTTSDWMDGETVLPGTPWRTEGVATTSLNATFSEIDNENELHTITLTSSFPITGSLTASHGGMVELFLTGDGVTDLTLSGLIPNKEYHLYRNHYGDHTPFTADSEGEYAYTTNLSENTYIYIQDVPSTFFLVNDGTGGDCGQIGTWDAGSVTCTLSGDVTQSIQIGSNSEGVSDGITLDGNGYTQTGSNTGNGVYVYNANFVTIKNITVTNFTVGVSLRESEQVALQNVQTNVYGAAVSSTNVREFAIRNSALKATNFGLSCIGAVDVTLEVVQVTTVRSTGIFLRDTESFSVHDVQITSSEGNGLYIQDSSLGSISEVTSTVGRTRAPVYVSGSTDTHFNHTIENFVANGLPLYYYTNKDNEILDGGGADVFNIYCIGCSNTTIQNYRFPEYTNGGIRLWGSVGVIVAQNKFDRPTVPLQILKTGGTIVHGNSFRSSAALLVPYVLYTEGVALAPTVMYRNTFYSSSPPVSPYSKQQDIIFSRAFPLGGNHWSSYDEVSEGCEDNDDDFVCDAPYYIPNSTEMVFVDEHPWVSANAWESLKPKNGLQLPFEEKYDGVRGVHSGGPYPERGYADSEVFTFKTVYTHSGSLDPEVIEVKIGGILTIPMQTDSSAQDPLLRDGDYTNGEQYVATTTLPKGSTTYGFYVQVGDKSFQLEVDANNVPLTCSAGYSSVAFFPGMQSSRLFEKNENDWFENQLWEPNYDADAQALVMKSDGTSLNTDIYTKTGPNGVLDELLGFGGNIYKSFLNDMNEWKEGSGLIADYEVFAYDWRLAFEDVLSGGKVEGEKLYFDPSHTDGVPYIFGELERLVDESDTGRVTVVAHSMGGLLVKKLLADLEDNPNHSYRHLLEKIDVVILVASPQLGTPKSVASLLHGIGQNFEPLANKETIRRIARDMPSAYTLAPSPLYFERVYDIDKAGVALDHTLLFTGRGEDVTDYESMRSFLNTNFGEAGIDLTIPMKPRSDYLEYAETLHARLDGWMPSGINSDGVPDFRVVQIAGWGIQDTLKGIEYVESQHRVDCEDGLTGPCTETYFDPRPVTTYDGDGTVVLPSAVAMGKVSDKEKGVETWYVDMYGYNKGLTKNQSHASILEIDSVRSLIQRILKDGLVDLTYIDSTSENFFIPESYLRLAMRSPVDISVVGTEGRVGITISADGVVSSKKEISNSYYFEFGEGKYLGVPLSGEEYSIELQGTGEGVFTLELIEERNGLVYDTKTFSDVPVTSLMQGELHISKLQDIIALELDSTGDGVADTIVYTDEDGEPASFGLLEREIQKLDTHAKKQLLQKVYLAQRFADMEKTRLSKMMLMVLKKEIVFLSSKKQSVKIKIEKRDAEYIVSIIEELQTTF